MVIPVVKGGSGNGEEAVGEKKVGCIAGGKDGLVGDTNRNRDAVGGRYAWLCTANRRGGGLPPGINVEKCLLWWPHPIELYW